jgi:Protein phosphatase 2C
VAARQVQPGVLVAAVADGHGHRRHFRSARGSRIAVAVACEAAAELAARLDGFDTAEQVQSEALHTLAPVITARWRDAVREDLAAEPFTAPEEAARAAGDDPLVAYGSTLLLAIAGRKWLVLAQIGDGDIVGIRPGGRPLCPVPGDPSLDGHRTTSLCGPRPERDFRAAVLDTSATALLGVLLATDGYGNAQVADPWADAVGADLAELISDHPPEWLAGQLPLWASLCASADGSADDTTIALLIAPSAAGDRHAIPDTVSDEAPGTVRGPARRPVPGTVPEAAPRAVPGTVPGTVPRAVPGVGGRPVTRASAAHRSRLAVIAAAAVVVVAAAVVAAIGLNSSSGAGSASCSAPSAGLGEPVAGSATVCDTLTHRQVRISLSGLPAGKRVALQAGGSVFVRAGGDLWVSPVDGPVAAWDDLGQVPAGAQQGLCLFTPSVVVADAGAGTSWTEVKVPVQSPAKLGTPIRQTSDPCPVGRG